jgi:hypothetical protein
MPLRANHQTLVTLAVLLSCLAFLSLTGSLTGLPGARGSGGCRVTVPIINSWVRPALYGPCNIPGVASHTTPCMHASSIRVQHYILTLPIDTDATAEAI